MQTTSRLVSLLVCSEHVAEHLLDIGRLILSTRPALDRKSTRLNSSHLVISYAVFCLKKKKKTAYVTQQLRLQPNKYTTVKQDGHAPSDYAREHRQFFRPMSAREIAACVAHQTDNQR